MSSTSKETKQTITLNQFTLLDSAGRLLVEAQAHLAETPEFKLFKQAEAHVAALRQEFGVPANVIDIKGELEVITPAPLPNLPSPSNASE